MVQITAEGNFYDQTSSKPLLNLDTFRLLEKLSADQIEEYIKLAIGKAQYYQADIFGWGRLLEKEYPHVWSQVEKNWPEVFSGLPADIQVDFELRRTYLTDESFVIR
jgi:spore germination protein KC